MRHYFQNKKWGYSTNKSRGTLHDHPSLHIAKQAATTETLTSWNADTGFSPHQNIGSKSPLAEEKL